LQHSKPGADAITGRQQAFPEKDLDALRTALAKWALLPDANTLRLSMMICAETPE